MHLWIGAAHPKELAAVIPGPLAGVADITILADDRRVLGGHNFQPAVEILRHRDLQAAITCLRIQSFAFPMLRKRNGEAAILDLGANFAAAILNGDSSVFRSCRELARASLEGDSAILGVRFRSPAKSFDRDTAIAHVQSQVGILWRLHQQACSQRVLALALISVALVP